MSLNWTRFLVRVALLLCSLELAYSELATEAKMEKIGCVSPTLIKRHNLNPQLYGSCEYRKRNATVLQHRRLPREIKPIFRGHPKPRGEVLANKFHMSELNSEQTDSLVRLINKIAIEYLYKCPPVIYYDSFVKKSEAMILESLFKVYKNDRLSAILILSNIDFLLIDFSHHLLSWRNKRTF